MRYKQDNRMAAYRQLLRFGLICIRSLTHVIYMIYLLAMESMTISKVHSLKYYFSENV
jgi:hypothetical protein